MNEHLQVVGPGEYDPFEIIECPEPVAAYEAPENKTYSDWYDWEFLLSIGQTRKEGF